MAARVIDGDSLWRSKKIKNVPKEYRFAYAWLLPLAEANGTFDCDPERIWADAFSFNTEITVETVIEMLDSFEKAGMLTRWEQDGKTWGFFNGMEKEGRLPAPSRQYRYKNLPPDPPMEKIKASLESEIHTAPGLNLLKRIRVSCREKLGIMAENEDYYKKDLKELGETYGRQEVMDAFEVWAETQSIPPKNPVKSFLKVADGFLQNKVKPKDPALDALCVSLYHIGGQTFTGKYRQLLNLLISEFSFHEIEKGYKEFISTKDDYDMKFVVRDFCEGGGKTVIQAMKEKEQQFEDQQNFIKKETKRQQQEVEQELNEVEVPGEL